MKAKNDKKTIWAWCMFDWANQSYNMVITTTIFPIYYVYFTTNQKTHYDKVFFFGHQFKNTVLQSYVLGTSYLLIVLMLPILTSIADYKGNKKRYLQFFTWMGALSCAGLFWFKPVANGVPPLELPLIFYGLACIGYCGGFVFYNSYLPQIATLEKQDDVSAKGFMYGYVGSLVLQLLCLLVIQKPTWFGLINDDLPSRISFLMVFVWWMGFSIIPFRILPKGEPNAGKHNYNVLTGGFKELARVFKKVRTMPLLKRFLSSFFFYSVGVQTIMLVAAQFASKELNIGEDTLIPIILVIQVVGVIGAYATAKLSDKYGNVKTLVGLVSIWTVLCLLVYFVSNTPQFFAAAVVVGAVMGGVQSISRSTYSKYLPPNIPDTASYFSFYDVTEKSSIVVGLFVFGLVEALSGKMRNSALVLDGFFAVGLILMVALLVAENKSKKQALVAA
ncbi:MFS transporter [Mucilaginibacter gotjawali]|uniref:UMF1 family MFS transporter n=2 Tax=Mucilaginibacter gotjawali TaxID=1550579 RepID=A0A839S9E7_9SPHI|nr:MFS transporter [Mucilaginibacter gotjawali]MBB3053610.1 UMF1 family MFS transporter [Mucilaginibacter gotjawali]BAU53870.1 Vacuole effluxer Atg22 like protein [Mucilaginibacter gotjawali]